MQLACLKGRVVFETEGTCTVNISWDQLQSLVDYCILVSVLSSVTWSLMQKKPTLLNGFIIIF